MQKRMIRKMRDQNVRSRQSLEGLKSLIPNGMKDIHEQMENSTFDMIAEKDQIEEEEAENIFASFKRTDGQVNQKERLKSWQMNQVYLKQVKQNRPMFEDGE